MYNDWGGYKNQSFPSPNGKTSEMFPRYGLFGGPVDESCAPVHPFPTEYETFEVGDTTMNVAMQGPSDAAINVLCLHGFPQGSYMWMPEFAPRLRAALSDTTVRVIAPDMRGVNRTMPKYEC